MKIRDDALDRAKAIAISLVLVWHLHPFAVPRDHSQIFLSEFQAVLDFFYIQISLIAVPLFILVSLYLFCGKLDTLGPAYALRRLFRLVVLYAAWTICQFTLFYVFHTYQGLRSGRGIVYPPLGDMACLLMKGGPPLPFAGDSIFYFLFVLTCLSGLMTVFHGILSRSPYRHMAAFFGTAIFLCYFQWLSCNGQGIPYWRLDGFLIYIPLTHLVRYTESSWRPLTVFGLFVCFAVFAGQDVILRNHFGSTGAYSRPSLVFGSTAVLASLRVFSHKFKRTSGIAAFLGANSLGVFAIHKYWQLVICLVVRHLPAIRVASPLDIALFVQAVFCVTLTCGTIYLLTHTRFRSLVR